MICKIFNLLEKYTLKLFLLLWVFFFFLRISSLKRSWEYYLINLWNFLVTLVTNVLVSISQMEKLGSERLICLCKLTYHVNSYVLRRTYGSCLVGYLYYPLYHFCNIERQGNSELNTYNYWPQPYFRPVATSPQHILLLILMFFYSTHL